MVNPQSLQGLKNSCTSKACVKDGKCQEVKIHDLEKMFDQFYEKMQELQKQTLQQIQKIESKSNVSQRNHDHN